MNVISAFDGITSMKRAGESDRVVSVRNREVTIIPTLDLVDSGFFQILAFQVLAGYIIFICGGYILFCVLSTM